MVFCWLISWDRVRHSAFLYLSIKKSPKITKITSVVCSILSCAMYARNLYHRYGSGVSSVCLKNHLCNKFIMKNLIMVEKYKKLQKFWAFRSLYFCKVLLNDTLKSCLHLLNWALPSLKEVQVRLYVQVLERAVLAQIKLILLMELYVTHHYQDTNVECGGIVCASPLNINIVNINQLKITSVTWKKFLFCSAM